MARVVLYVLHSKRWIEELWKNPVKVAEEWITVGYKMMSGNIMMSAERMKKLAANERIDFPTSS
jgi:hypothetical protein